MSFFYDVKPNSVAAHSHILKCVLLGQLENAFLDFNLEDFPTLTLYKTMKPKEAWNG